ARRYYRVAKQRLDEAKLILEGLKLAAAAEYLAGYAVECILKALLVALVPESELPQNWKGIVEWLKEDVGHDLKKLREEIRERGLSLPKAEIASLDFIAEGWKPESRYTPGSGDLIHAKRFLVAVETILQWADRSI